MKPKEKQAVPAEDDTKLNASYMRLRVIFRFIVEISKVLAPIAISLIAITWPGGQQ